MSKGNDPIQRVKDHWRVNHFVIVKLTQIFDVCDALLIELEIVLLQSKRNSLQGVVDDVNNKILMIAIQSVNKESQQMDIAILYFGGLAKDAFQYTDNLNRLAHS